MVLTSVKPANCVVARQRHCAMAAPRVSAQRHVMAPLAAHAAAGPWDDATDAAHETAAVTRRCFFAVAIGGGLYLASAKSSAALEVWSTYTGYALQPDLYLVRIINVSLGACTHMQETCMHACCENHARMCMHASKGCTCMLQPCFMVQRACMLTLGLPAACIMELCFDCVLVARMQYGMQGVHGHLVHAA